MIGLYNVLFTAWPPIVLGLTDQFVTAPFLLANPGLYRFGQENAFYNSKTFWQSAANGFLQSFLAFSLTAIIMIKGIVLNDGKEVTLFFMGTTVFAGVVLTVVLKAALLIKYNPLLPFYYNPYLVIGRYMHPLDFYHVQSVGFFT